MGKRKLTRKELVEHIKQIMPSDFNEIEKLAFIENEIAKQISFDEQYLWGDRETKEKVPIILDEAFAYYDNERLKNILIYLTTEFSDRQIIILTCTKREKEILEHLNIQFNNIIL